MSTIAIRWLGAFGHSDSLTESLNWELCENRREVAAEWYDGSHAFRGIKHTVVGLLIDKGAIIRRYNGDVWSEVRGERLVPTRNSNTSNLHSECFCTPKYRGIVVRRHLDQLRPDVRRTVVAAAKKYHLAVFYYNDQINTLKKLTVK